MIEKVFNENCFLGEQRVQRQSLVNNQKDVKSE